MSGQETYQDHLFTTDPKIILRFYKDVLALSDEYAATNFAGLTQLPILIRLTKKNEVSWSVGEAVVKSIAQICVGDNRYHSKKRIPKLRKDLRSIIKADPLYAIAAFEAVKKQRNNNLFSEDNTRVAINTVNLMSVILPSHHSEELKSDIVNEMKSLVGSTSTTMNLEGPIKSALSYMTQEDAVLAALIGKKNDPTPGFPGSKERMGNDDSNTSFNF